MSLIAHYQFEGDATDSYGTYNGIEHGSPSYADGKVGQCLDLTGNTGDMGVELVQWADAEQLRDAGGFSLWFNSTTTTGDSGARVISWDHSDHPTVLVDQSQSGGQDVNTVLNDPRPGWIGVSLAENDWHHVALSWDADGGAWFLMLDGTVVTSGEDYAVTSTAPRPIVIGGNTELDGDISGDPFVGYIDEARLFDHGLSVAEAKELSLAKVGHWKLNGSATDCSGYGNHGTVEDGSATSNTILNSQCHEWTGDGTGAIRIPNAPSLQTDQDMTLAYWIHPTDIGTERQNPFDKAYGGELTITLETNGNLNHYHGDAGDEGQNYVSPSPAYTLSQDEWTHVIYTRDISTNTVEYYINGEHDVTRTYNSAIQPSKSTDDILLGNGYTSQLHGRLADVRLHASYLDDPADAAYIYENRASLDNIGGLSAHELIETPQRRGADSAEYFVPISNCLISAYEDDTTVYLNGAVETTLDAQDTYNVSCSPGDIVAADKPITSGEDRPGVPLGWSGTRFAWRNDRYPPINMYIYAPYADATVDIYDCSVSATTADRTVTVSQGTHVVEATTDTNNQWILESDEPVVVFAQPTGDYRPLFPASTELFGIPSGDAHVIALEDNTTITKYESDGTTSTTTLNRGAWWAPGGTGSQFAGASLRLVADKPIAAESQADADGGDMTTFHDREGMATHFVLPHNAEFVSFVGMDSDATVDVYDGTGAYVDTKTVSGGANADEPTTLKIDAPSETYTLDAGYKFVCSSPQWAMFENLGNDDETTFFGSSLTGNFYGPGTELPSDTGIVTTGELVERGAESPMSTGPAHENVLADGAVNDGVLQVPYDNAIRGTLSIVEAPTMFGRYAVKHEATDADSYTNTGYTNDPAAWPEKNAHPGEDWTGSVYVKADSGTVDVQLHVFAGNASSFELDSSTTGLTVGTEWTRLEVTHTMPANTEWVTMRVDNDGGAGAIVYWNGFQLEHGSTARAFSEGDLRLAAQFSEVV
ncbi:LamG domain-containing protein (plasmid) [Halorarum halophilum]|uniref:LamG domain-containing protein n=1 Tax=Halorarum halophilum TaxID=2743090 RepID=A0A7D5GPX6_9EURY|nr:LamG domain-containing protein [Halobaculum halophilum]QLG30187.1 LamG domain-containing protein [Halobaculum halophilum]